jgi:hypothetical protein
VDEGCLLPLAPPPAIAPPAQSTEGNDNVKPKKPRNCPKGKRKVKKHGKVRCVKKKQHKSAKAKSRAGANRGAGK